MPPFASGVTREVVGNYTVSLLDHRGKRRAARVPIALAADATERTAIQVAIGNASNAAVVETNSGSTDRILNVSHPDVVVFDEAYSTVDHVLVLNFQDDDGAIASIEIPAPDLSLFNPDGETFNPAQAQSAALVAALLAGMNADGGGTYVFSNGYLANRRSDRAKARRKPGTIMEPTLGDFPQDLPGV